MAYPAWAHHPSNEAFAQLRNRVNELEEWLDELENQFKPKPAQPCKHGISGVRCDDCYGELGLARLTEKK